MSTGDPEGRDAATFVGDLFDGTDAPAPADPPDSPESTAPRFVLEEEVGRGGLGSVHRAIDTRLGRPVAVKNLHHASLGATRRFEREMHLTSRLQHPNIVPVYDGGRDEAGTPYLAMRLVEGRTLAEAIAARPTLQERLELLPHVIDVCNAVAYAHSQRIVHRDIKPENVLIGGFGETVLIDWGLAKDLDLDEPTEEVPAWASGSASGSLGSASASMTRVGTVLGTPAYMAPEQASGRVVDTRSDVYALGAMLYETLSGRRPYSETHGAEAVLDRVVAGPPTGIRTLAPHAPPDLVAVVDRAMARMPDARYPSAEQLAADLDTFAAGRFVEAYQYSLIERIRRAIQRNPLAFGILGVTAVLGALAISLIVRAYTVAEHARTVAESSRDAERAARDALALESARSVAATKPGRALVLLDELSGDTPFDGAVRTVASTAWAAGHPQLFEATRSDVETGPEAFPLVVRSGTSLIVLDEQLQTRWSLEVPDLVLSFKPRASFLGVCLGERVLVATPAGETQTYPLPEPCTQVFPYREDSLLLQLSTQLLLLGPNGPEPTSFPHVDSLAHVEGRGWALATNETRTWTDGDLGATTAEVGGNYGVRASPDGAYLALVGERPAMQLVDRDNQVMEVSGLQQDWLTPLAWFDADWVVVGGSKPLLEVVDVRTRTIVRRLALDARPLHLVRLGDGQIAAITESGTLLKLTRLPGDEIQTDVLGVHPGRPHRLLALRDGRIAVATEDGLAAFAPQPSGRRLLTSNLGKVSYLQAWRAPDGTPRVLVASDAGAGALDPETGVFQPWSDRPAVWMQECGSTWWIGHRDGLSAVSLANGPAAPEVSWSIDGKGIAWRSVCRPDAEGAWVGFGYPGEILLVNDRTVERSFELLERDAPYALRVEADGQLQVAASGWWVVDPNGDAVRRSTTLQEARGIVRLEGRLFAIYRDGTGETEDGQKLVLMNESVARVAEVEGGVLVLGESGGAAFLESLDRDPIRLDGHVQFLIRGARAPNAGVVATGGWDAQVRLWDLSVDPPASRVLTGHEDAVSALAWSHDGRTLYSADRLGRVMAWSDPLPHDPNALRRAVAEMAQAVREGRAVP